MNVFNRLSKALLVCLLAAAVVCAFPSASFAADKVTLKDGTVLEGKITREGEGFLFIKVKIGAIEQERLVATSDIKTIERDADKDAGKKDPKSADDAKGKDAKDKKDPAVAGDAKAGESKPAHSGATRVAILNFGPPSSWQDKVLDTVGKQILAKSFAEAIPMLEKAKVDVVVIRINSGGGALAEIPRFHRVFENMYKPRFRTVAWVESAISAAAMSPYVIEEFYFLPEGNLGACTGWSGDLHSVTGVGEEQLLIEMEEGSAMGKRDSKIMRSMQIQEPLSCNIDEVTGEVTWFQDTSGHYLVNQPHTILTLNAQDAVKYKFARAIAATKEELAKAMGLNEVEWVAQDATDYIDQAMRDATKAEKNIQIVAEKYDTAFNLASQLQDCKQRGTQIAIARRYLSELRRLLQASPNLAPGLNKQWFEEREEELRKLAC
ncbi:MAG TPA: hypothetical protein PK308_00735 [Phycisphaerales bacterium]|nr:hypothetical protein [Phycisphaerales bacterium]